MAHAILSFVLRHSLVISDLVIRHFPMNILDTIVEQKKREVAQLPARLIAAGDLRDALLERGEQRDFIAALKNPRRCSAAVPALALPLTRQARRLCYIPSR